MSSKHFKSIFFHVCCMFLITCKDNEPVPVYKEEDPYDNFLTLSGFNQKSITSKNDPQGVQEFGFVIAPRVNGKITALTLQIPDANSSLRVTVWDADAKRVIRTEVFSITVGGLPVKKEIEPISLAKDKKYMLSMSTDDYYIRFKNDGTPIAIPFEAGNILYYGIYRNTEGSAQTFPEFGFDYTSCIGDIRFTFIQTN